MAGNSAIEWTDATWNPIVGCSIVSPGCTNCYAMKMAARIEAMNAAVIDYSRIAKQYDGTTKRVNGHAVWTGNLALASDNILLQPLKRKKPTTYFVNSMGDLFHEDCPDEWIDNVFTVMALAPQHTFQVLTKRAKRMREYVSNAEKRIVNDRLRGNPSVSVSTSRSYRSTVKLGGEWPWPLPNVWLGVSTERQQEADERIPLLLQTPAAIRFISAEPLLGPIDLSDVKFDFMPGYFGDALQPHHVPHCDRHHRYPKLDWVIVGGESGPNARPAHVEWLRSLRDQCASASVPFFFKQFGEWLPWSQFNGASIEDDPEQTRFATCEWEDGRWNDVGRPMWCDTVDGNIDDEQCVGRVGKKRAGRLLDGKLHNAMPEIAR